MNETMSGLIGALKTAGKTTFLSVASLFSLYTVMSGLAAASAFLILVKLHFLCWLVDAWIKWDLNF